MAVDNKFIIDRITSARKEQNIKQKEIAIFLKKSAAAISNLESGTVQVAAEDLSILSDVLNKPIEYFYGEEMDGKETQGIIQMLRRIPEDQRLSTMKQADRFYKMQDFVTSLNIQTNRKPTNYEIKDFISSFYEFYDQQIKVMAQLDKIKVIFDKAINEINLQGFSGFEDPDL